MHRPPSPWNLQLAAAAIAALVAFTGPSQAGATASRAAADTSAGTSATSGSGAAATRSVNALLDQARPGPASDDNFLPPDQAFRLSAAADGPDRVRLVWAIAPGYYLYRDRIKLASPVQNASLGRANMPDGQTKSDAYFGKQVVYHNELIATIAVARAAGSALTLPLNVTYQGCAEAGLCYPPTTRNLSIELPAGGSAAPGGHATAGATTAGAMSTSAATAGATSASAVMAAPVGGFQSEQDRLATMIRSGNMLGVLGSFFVLGLLLAFTPCVLPMVPILSGLIAGHGHRVTTARAFSLSLTYVLGMALTYTITGAAFAAAGQQVQALFQQTWIIVLFAALFLALALSMFGIYTLQMPSFLQTRLSEASNRQRAGSFGGVAIMGALSALIVTTCVAPPLVATLAVIGQSGDIVRGASALFAMSLGMGAPLLVVGASAGRLLPRAGAWMDGVKKLFGVMMLAMAVWMLTRVVSPRAGLALFAVPALTAAVVLWHFAGGGRGRGRLLARTAGVAAAIYAAVLLLGAGLGNQDPLAPLTRSNADTLAFHPISNGTDLAREVQAASAAHQAVLLDFYADWCTSCKEMERYTFTDPQIRAALRSVRLLRADVTANSDADQALLHQFHIFGPPTIALYDTSGNERHEFRVVGYMKPAEFAALLRQALGSERSTAGTG